MTFTWGPSAPAARATAALAGVLLIAGCSTVPRADTVSSLTRPSVTQPGATAIVERYNDVVATANSRRSDDLVDGVQAGDLLRQTEAAYKISRFLKKPVAGAPEFVADSVGAPEYGGYPMHFVASGNHRLGLWEHSSAGAPWRLTCSVPSTVPMPDITRLQAVAPTTTAGVAESPVAAATKFAKLLEVGVKSPYARLFAAAPEIAKMQQDLADSHAIAGRDHILAITDTFTLTAPPVGFRTLSGEVLAFFTLSDANEMRPQFGAMWPVGQNTAAFSEPNHLYRTALTTTQLQQFAIVIPAKKEAKIRVLGFTSQLVDSGGY